MDKRKLKIALSLAVLIPCVLYAAGIIAQFIININAWKAAGSDYRTSPGLPSSQISEVVRALFHFPEGLIAIGVVVLGIAVTVHMLLPRSAYEEMRQLLSEHRLSKADILMAGIAACSNQKVG